jgi:hypothetical protein
MGSNIDDQVIAGTNVNKNPQLPAPKIVKTQGMESGVIETPLSDNSPVPPPSTPKPKIKKEVTIREVDNGYILTVWAGPFKEEWVFGSLKKSIKAIVAFLNTQEETEDEK